MSKKVYHIFWKSMIGVVTIIVLAVAVLQRGQKDKNEFYMVAGKLIYLEKDYQELPHRHPGKYRYLQIDTHPKVFEVFIGNESGDFKPDFERIDQLKVGDQLLIYYDENSSEDDWRISRLAQYIDKEQQPYYIRGSWDKYMGYFLLGTAVAFALWLLYLKAKGRVI